MARTATTGPWSLLRKDLGGGPLPWSALGCLSGRLFSFGGDGWSATVQASDDGGRTWTVLQGNCPPRLYAAGAIMDRRLWIAGGQENDDVWCSRDGRTWSRAAARAPWGRRWAHALVPFAGRLYLLAGTEVGQGPRGDVWAWDGLDWRVVNARAFTPRYGAAGAVLGDRMVLLGGAANSEAPPLAEALISLDHGRTWTFRPVPWAPRWGAAAATLDGALYLVGGVGTSGAICRDVWATRDAVTWTPMGEAPWTRLTGFGLGACGDHLVLAGGVDWDKLNRAVWAFRPPAA